MCKGMKYKLMIKKPKCEECDIYEKISMNDAIEKIKEKLDEYYYLDDLNVSSHMLYNMLNRPEKCNKIMRKFITFQKN